jgi:hypothetical protein
MDLKVMSELCADSRTVPLIPGMHLNIDGKTGRSGTEPAPDLAGLERMPSITLLIYPAEAAGSPLPTSFRDRLPLEALDKTAYLPSEGSVPDVLALDELSQRVGHMVQVPKGDLTPPSLEQMPGLHDRLVPLDADGRTTTWDDAVYLRMQPPESPTGKAWSDLPEGLVQVMASALAGQIYLGGRIVPGSDTVDIGLASQLVDVLNRDLAAGFGRRLTTDDIAAARAGGAGAPSRLPGYVELLRLMEQSPAGSQALVKVDDAAATPHVFLAHHDGFNVQFLDLGAGPTGARFPKEHGDIELTMLPGIMPLGDRIDSLRTAGRPQPTDLVRPLLLPAGVWRFDRNLGSDLPVLVVGAKAPAATDPFVGGLVGHLPDVGQPIIVLDGDAGRLGPDHIDVMGALYPQYGVHGQVPVVVARHALSGDVAALHGVLDRAGASLVHQVPSGLGSAWTVREAQSGIGPGTAAGGKRLFDQLGLPLLKLAAGEDRRPKQTPPPAKVATFLTTPLTAQVGTKDLQTLFGPEAKKLAPLVRQIATQSPIFAGNSAAMQLAAMDQADAVTGFARDPGNGREALFKPMLGVPGETPAERRQGIQTLLPFLAELAGGYGMTDFASSGILSALNGKLAGTMNDQQVKDAIWNLKDHLPEQVRPAFVRLIAAVKRQIPDADGPGLDRAAEYILTCPPGDGAS